MVDLTPKTVDASIVIPCFNERLAIEDTARQIFEHSVLRESLSVDMIIVDDGSTDGSGELLDHLAEELNSSRFRVVHHRRNLGYGAALKSGIRRSRAEYICITDADGTYPHHRINELLQDALGRDMVVGARLGEEVTYSKLRSLPKLLLIPWVSFLSGCSVPDINSGLRVFRRDLALRFLNLLPDGFSFTTTITICFLRNRYDVLFVPISYARRIGKSHIKPIRDTLRFVQLIGRTGMYFAPLRLLLPVSAFLGIMFLVSGLYDVAVLGNLTDKTILFAFASLNVFMFAMLADMIDKRSGI